MLCNTAWAVILANKAALAAGKSFPHNRIGGANTRKLQGLPSLVCVGQLLLRADTTSLWVCASVRGDAHPPAPDWTHSKMKGPAGLAGLLAAPGVGSCRKVGGLPGAAPAGRPKDTPGRCLRPASGLGGLGRVRTSSICSQPVDARGKAASSTASRRRPSAAAKTASSMFKFKLSGTGEGRIGRPRLPYDLPSGACHAPVRLAERQSLAPGPQLEGRDRQQPDTARPLLHLRRVVCARAALQWRQCAPGCAGGEQVPGGASARVRAARWPCPRLMCGRWQVPANRNHQAPSVVRQTGLADRP
jgi:hypothetical protein